MSSTKGVGINSPSLNNIRPLTSVHGKATVNAPTAPAARQTGDSLLLQGNATVTAKAPAADPTAEAQAMLRGAFDENPRQFALNMARLSLQKMVAEVTA